MWGQWIGSLGGTNTGSFILNVDSDPQDRGGLHIDDGQAPLLASVEFSMSGTTVQGVIKDIRGGTPSTPPPAPSGTRLPQAGQFKAKIQDDNIEGEWETDAGTQGTFVARRAELAAPRPPDVETTWKKFTSWAFDEVSRSDRPLFRGHSTSDYQLVTTFHRAERRNLLRYDTEDLLQLLRYVEPAIGARYNLSNPFDFLAFLDLAQHRGFPTPLLDWTESPFIAAFFAFTHRAEAMTSQKSTVRIYAFEKAQWPYVPVQTIADVGPRFCVLYPRSYHNSRALPQQSVSTFAAVVDIERFIESVETARGRRFLRRVDIPVSERAVAIKDLQAMGITPASLFPGLEGICRAMAEKLFRTSEGSK